MNAPTRSYASPLREDQAQQTRDRIVAAAVALIVDGVAAVTMPGVAGQAGVSLRTVFRHFPTRDALLDAAWDSLNGRMGQMPPLDGLQAVTDFLPELFERYGSMERELRAVILSPVLEASRLRLGSSRRRAMKAAVDGLIEGEDRAQVMARAAAYVLTIPASLLFLKNNHGLTTAEAGATVAWAVETLVKAARDNPPKAPTR